MLKEVQNIDVSQADIFRDQIDEIYENAVKASLVGNENEKNVAFNKYSQKLLNEVKNHLQKPKHPITRFINKFKNVFSETYSNLVETTTANSKHELMDRIRKKGEDFSARVFESVKHFQAAVFDSLIYLYDPTFKGVLESIEREIDDTLADKIITEQVYFVLLVLSRIRNIEKDKELRFKIKALQEASVKDFGVSDYLLLDGQTPILELAIRQETEYQ